MINLFFLRYVVFHQLLGTDPSNFVGQGGDGAGVALLVDARSPQKRRLTSRGPHIGPGKKPEKFNIDTKNRVKIHGKPTLKGRELYRAFFF